MVHLLCSLPIILRIALNFVVFMYRPRPAPSQLPGVTFGLPNPAGPAGTSPYTFLAAPTPWAPNAGVKPGVGPFIRRYVPTPFC